MLRQRYGRGFVHIDRYVLSIFSACVCQGKKLMTARGPWRLTVVRTRTCIDREGVRESRDPSPRSADVGEGQGTRALLYPAVPGQSQRGGLEDCHF